MRVRKINCLPVTAFEHDWLGGALLTAPIRITCCRCGQGTGSIER